MNVLVTGEFHGKLPKDFEKIDFNKIDLIILVGDISEILPEHRTLKYKAKKEGWNYFERIRPKEELSFIMKEMKTGREILKRIDELGIPTLIIPGNVDRYDYAFREDVPKEIRENYYEKYLLKGLKNIIDIQIKPYSEKGIEFVGFGGFSQADRIDNQKGLITKFEDAVQGMEEPIFIFHLPPYGIFDFIINEKSPYHLRNIGSKKLLELFLKYKPKFTVVSHLHEHYGLDNINIQKVLAQGFRNITLLKIENGNIEIHLHAEKLLKR